MSLFQNLVFKAIFYGPLKESNTVEIVDSNVSAFAEFLQFVYLPEVTLTIGNIKEIIRLADKYDMMDCFEAYATFLQSNLTTENMVWSYQLVITLKNTELLKFCEQHIENNTRKILRSALFLQCTHDMIDHILKLNMLECDEITFFNGCIEWAKSSCQKNDFDANISENLRNQLNLCFNLIRFGAMEANEVAKLLQNNVIKGLFTRDELAEIWQSKWISQTEAELFNHEPCSKPPYKWDRINQARSNSLFLGGQIFCSKFNFLTASI